MDFPKTIRISDGRALTLRPAEASDEGRLRAFFSSLPEEDLLFMREDVTDPAVIGRWMKRSDYNRVLPLLAHHGDWVVADAALHMHPFGWARHVGEVRLVVATEWRRLGLGRVLIGELLNLAQEHDIEILETQLLEGQHGAQHAFEALGFSAEMVLRDRGCDRSGRRRNVIVMRNDVADMWRRMEDLMEDMPSSQSGMY